MRNKKLPFLKRKALQIYIWFLISFISDDIRISKAKYYLKNNRKLNLTTPVEFMEKLQWLKFYHYKESYSNYVDKYAVREFVSERIGKKYLNEIICIVAKFDDINFENLPNQFALKATHGSGYNIIVNDKSKLDIKKTQKKVNKFLKSDYSKVNQENIYRGVKPKILIEKMLPYSEGSVITDYKFYCFNGSTNYIFIKSFENGIFKNCFYDTNWNKIKEDKIRHNFLEKEFEKPANLEEMITVAQKLSRDFIFVRVDLYTLEDRVYFGELTFFPSGCLNRLSVEKLNLEFGNLITLPN